MNINMIAGSGKKIIILKIFIIINKYFASKISHTPHVCIFEQKFISQSTHIKHFLHGCVLLVHWSIEKCTIATHIVFVVYTRIGKDERIRQEPVNYHWLAYHHTVYLPCYYWKCDLPMNNHGRSAGWSVGLSVFYYFLKRREVTLPYSYTSPLYNDVKDNAFKNGPV